MKFSEKGYSPALYLINQKIDSMKSNKKSLKSFESVALLNCSSVKGGSVPKKKILEKAVYIEVLRREEM
ncbi:MAG: hypothetical protein ACI8ZM_002010 [Crocinitomix sp.]|jgi:hypothetical protein